MITVYDLQPNGGPGMAMLLIAALLATESQFQFHNAAETILHIVNRAVAASLVGEPLSRNESWLHLSLESTINTGLLCRQLQDYPAFIRPLVSPYTTSRRKLKSNLDAAQKLLEPIIASRERYQDNIDILQWLLDTYEGQDLDQSGSFITRQVLFLVTAATRSTANTIVNIIFDLLAYPECQELLRAEIRDSVSAAGGWNITSLSYMKKLDSFIKESQRLNHHILRKLPPMLSCTKDGLQSHSCKEIFTSQSLIYV